MARRSSEQTARKDGAPGDDRSMCETVFAYHERTKHHFHRSARSLGYLDWATQPDPFRRFAGSELVRLPIPTGDSTPPYEDIYVPGKVASVTLTADSISRFFYTSMALSAWKQVKDVRWSLPWWRGLHCHRLVFRPLTDG